MKINKKNKKQRIQKTKIKPQQNKTKKKQN